MIAFYYSLKPPPPPPPPSKSSSSSKVPDYEVVSIKQAKQHQKLQQSLALPMGLGEIVNENGSPQDTERTGSSGTATHQTGSESERIRQCGSLFDRRATINQELLDEFFRREPCPYNQCIYKHAARIFNCLKADLNENPILKSLKQQQMKEKGLDVNEQSKITDIPKIQYTSDYEKRNTLQLSFLTLKFQKVIEELIDTCQLYDSYSDLKDESSLTCTVLFDYMIRKFQLRDKLLEEPYDNADRLVTLIETTIHSEKTNLAAALAKNRIRADALTLEDLLPKELREVDQHRAELPLYCWINPLKASVAEMTQQLVEEEGLTQVEVKRVLERKCFMIDPHCPNVLMFHYSLRDRIVNSEYVKSAKLVIQDKSSCLAPHTVMKLLTKKDDVVVTNLSGGLVAAFIGSMMGEYEGKVMVFGTASEEKYQEINVKLQQIGCSKYVKLMREEFLEVRSDDVRLENVKVILVNAACSKSALMNPMEFLFQEGEDVKFLRDYTLDVNNPNKLKKCIQTETSYLKHALKIPKIRAVVYQTYSKNSSENENLITQSLEEFNENRKALNSLPYKISPPVIPLTAEDIRNKEVVKDIKFLQFKPSNKMNGCFIALLSRDIGSTVYAINNSSIFSKSENGSVTFLLQSQLSSMREGCEAYEKDAGAL